jgi:hypothetical protein
VSANSQRPHADGVEDHGMGAADDDVVAHREIRGLIGRTA